MALSVMHDIKYYAPIATSKLYDKQHNFLTLIALNGRSKTEYNTRIPRFIWRISKDDHTAKTQKPSSTHKVFVAKNARSDAVGYPDMSHIPASFSDYFKH